MPRQRRQRHVPATKCDSSGEKGED
jgi:hypothetical protein